MSLMEDTKGVIDFSWASLILKQMSTTGQIETPVRGALGK